MSVFLAGLKLFCIFHSYLAFVISIKKYLLKKSFRICHRRSFTYTLLCFVIIVILVAVFAVVAADRSSVCGCRAVCDVRGDIDLSLCCHLLPKPFKHKVGCFVRSLVLLRVTHPITIWCDRLLTSSLFEASELSSEPAAAAATTFCWIAHNEMN